ncbi:MAG: hypothetical protein MUF10_00275 [Thermoanaerobaculaceae bacterium]|jgi:hypothetical protein|nr:hypothetical protein [Thermoanaerobaculaceae bacterium]
MSATLLDLARRAAGGGVTTPTPSAAAPTRSDLLRLAGDAAEAVNRHCEGCERCRPEDFTGDVLRYPLCPEGLELRRRYRTARRLALVAR